LVKIVIQGLQFGYKSSLILNDVSFDVGDTQILGILGPNGSGKSTLIKCINKILKPKGSILIDEIPLNHLSISDIAKKMGYVPQSEAMGMSITVFDAVLMGRRIHMGWKPSSYDLEIVQSILIKMGIDDLALEDIWEISGGQRQRVYLARALAQEPTILLLDEPTSSLDIKHQLDTLETLRSLVKELNISIIMAIHDINLAARYSDIISLIMDGQIFKIGKPLDILTPETIFEVYGVHADFYYDTQGIPVVVPVCSAK